jgi:hypothetical protein
MRLAMLVNQIISRLRNEPSPMYLGEAFDARTLGEMGLALSTACDTLPVSLNRHANRTQIALRIVKCVEGGERTYRGMVTAGLAAIAELRARHHEINH